MSDAARRRRLADGLCATCGGKPLPGLRRCEPCRRRYNKYMRERAARCAAWAVCPRCTKRLTGTGTMCAACQKKANASSAALRARRAGSGRLSVADSEKTGDR